MSAECDLWQRSLERSLAERARSAASRDEPVTLNRVIVLETVGSTQDVAKQRGAVIGEVITTLRQTAGHGRFGRSWADTEHDGVAVSIVVPMLAAEQLVMRSAVAVADALELILLFGLTENAASEVPRSSPTRITLGIKWPNDVLAPDGGKLAGILIDHVGDAAIIGIGINVAQRAFDPALASRARSLAMIGVHVERPIVLGAVLSSIDRWLCAPDAVVRDTYRSRDVLRGSKARFKVADRTVEGQVIEVDPVSGIRVLTESGEQTLPAALTTLAVDFEPNSPR